MLISEMHFTNKSYFKFPRYTVEVTLRVTVSLSVCLGVGQILLFPFFC
jgi:hypothetical protein